MNVKIATATYLGIIIKTIDNRIFRENYSLHKIPHIIHTLWEEVFLKGIKNYLHIKVVKNLWTGLYPVVWEKTCKQNLKQYLRNKKRKANTIVPRQIN